MVQLLHDPNETVDDPDVATNVSPQPAGGSSGSKAESPEATEEWMFPSSFAQRRLWFLDQLEPGNTLYNVPGAFRVRGKLDAEILDQAFRALVARHETLRTTFRAVSGEPMQIVSAKGSFRLANIDLTKVPAAAREQEVSRIVREESERPFDLVQGPLIRAALLDLQAGEQVLLLSLHHIITDTWSQEVLMRELVTAYAALLSHMPVELPELPIQYADFAAWQREAMKGQTLENELNWWRQRLDGVPPLELPALPGHEQQGRTPEGETFLFELPQNLTAAVRSVAQREGVTLFMAMLAGWKGLLGRYSGQTDIAIGSPISDRGRTETEGLIGFFLNTLVMRTSLQGNPTVREALLRVRDTALETFAHQDLPFDMIVEHLQPVRTPGKNPLLKAMFVLMTGEEKVWRTPGAVIEPMPIEESKAKFDLMLHLRDTGRTIKGALVYDKVLFETEMIRRVATHYETLLEAMTDHPDAPLNSLPLIGPGERETILKRWNDTGAPYPAKRSVQALFREQAGMNPGAVAVEDGSTRLTYGELDRQSDAIAAALASKGVKIGDCVGISLKRSAEFIASILGILKAGATWVPLDASHPPSRLEGMLKQAGAKLVIGDPVGGEAEAVSSAECGQSTASPPPDAGNAVTGGDVACIMFTSGSTGTPKGVRVPHQGITRLVINTNYIEFTPGDGVAHASNTSFDASNLEIWGALLHGARLVIVPPETLLSPQELAEFIRERKITIMFLTTPLFHHLAREIPAAFGGLRYLVTGGDALQPDAARAILTAARPAHLINGYGPTEVTTFAICHDVTEVAPGAVSVPIGRPISNTSAYILDTARQPVPAGVAGELYLGGPGVAKGYLGNPEATEAAFIPDPFSEDAASRLYKTGDLARWRADGIIEFLGRADNQVKIRGFRVEPGEIEAALLQHRGVRQAKVVAQLDSTGQNRLIACIAPQPGAALTEAALREHLLGLLPDYMAPAGYLFLDTLPLNANGKVDLAAIKVLAPEVSAHPAQSAGTWMEATLTEIWEKLLERKPIGVTDDFFDLGGHSLLAIRMLAEVEKQTGIKIPPKVLFEDPAIRHLAAAARRPSARTPSPMVAVQSEGTLTPFFFLHGDFVEGGLYSIRMARQLGADRPFYAIDPHGVHDKAPHSIEEMAAERLKLVRQVQPQGPYALGGFCNGGLIAFEMARQLEAAGEKISSLILLSVDGSNAEFSWLAGLIGLLPGSAQEKFLQFIRWRERILFARAAWRHQLDALAAPVPFISQPRRFARKAVRILRKLFGLMAPHPEPPAPGMETMQPEAAGVDIGLIYHQACTAYVPQPYGGPAHILWPAEMELRDATAGWSAVIPQIRLLQVPGGHFSCLQGENMTVVAEEIRKILADGQSSAEVAVR